MFLRKRKSNLSLERAVYKPAEKDSTGKILVHPVRTTKYLGSIKAWVQYAHVPDALLAKLDDAEKAELKDALKENEPKTDSWLNSLSSCLKLASKDLKRCAGLDLSQDRRKALETAVKAAEVEWRAFFAAAQAVGLKRKLNRPKKGKPADAPNTAALEGPN